MAFTVGSRARVKLTQAVVFPGALSQLNPQPPTIGVVTDNTPTMHVIAVPGAASFTEDETFLEEITTAAQIVRDAMIDKVVTGQISAASPGVAAVLYTEPYTGRVVDVYNVSASPKVLIRSLSNGMYYELPFAQVMPLGDR